MWIKHVKVVPKLSRQNKEPIIYLLQLYKTMCFSPDTSNNTSKVKTMLYLLFEGAICNVVNIVAKPFTLFTITFAFYFYYNQNWKGTPLKWSLSQWWFSVTVVSFILIIHWSMDTALNLSVNLSVVNVVRTFCLLNCSIACDCYHWQML